MVSAEGGSVPNAVGYGEGFSLSSRLGILGERRELPQRGPGQSPGRKRVLAYFEGHIHFRTVQATFKVISFWRDRGAFVTLCFQISMRRV